MVVDRSVSVSQVGVRSDLLDGGGAPGRVRDGRLREEGGPEETTFDRREGPYRG